MHSKHSDLSTGRTDEHLSVLIVPQKNLGLCNVSVIVFVEYKIMFKEYSQWPLSWEW